MQRLCLYTLRILNSKPRRSEKIKNMHYFHSKGLPLSVELTTINYWIPINFRQEFHIKQDPIKFIFNTQASIYMLTIIQLLGLQSKQYSHGTSKVYLARTSSAVALMISNLFFPKLVCL